MPNHLAAGLLLPVLGSCSLLFSEQGAASDAATGTKVDAATGCSEAPTLGDLAVSPLACGETQLNLSSVLPLFADSECPVISLRWSLSKRDNGGIETELFSYTGLPDDPLPQEARVLGGSFVQPTFNLTSYHGASIGQFEITEKGTGIVQLFQDFGALADEPYRFRVAVASSMGQSVRARLFKTGSTDGLPAYGILDLCVGEEDVEAGDCAVPTKLTTFLLDAFATGGIELSARLRFKMGGVGIYWFDLVSLGPVATRLNQIASPSFPIPLAGSSSPWKFNCAASTCSYQEVPIPVPLQEYGAYVLRLTAIGAGKLESETRQLLIMHEGC